MSLSPPKLQFGVLNYTTVNLENGSALKLSSIETPNLTFDYTLSSTTKKPSVLAKIGSVGMNKAAEIEKTADTDTWLLLLLGGLGLYGLVPEFRNWIHGLFRGGASKAEKMPPTQYAHPFEPFMAYSEALHEGQLKAFDVLGDYFSKSPIAKKVEDLTKRLGLFAPKAKPSVESIANLIAGFRGLSPKQQKEALATLTANLQMHNVPEHIIYTTVAHLARAGNLNLKNAPRPPLEILTDLERPGAPRDFLMQELAASNDYWKNVAAGKNIDVSPSEIKGKKPKTKVKEKSDTTNTPVATPDVTTQLLQSASGRRFPALPAYTTSSNFPPPSEGGVVPKMASMPRIRASILSKLSNFK